MNHTHFIVISVATTGLVTENRTPKLLEIAARHVAPGPPRRSTGPGGFVALVSHPSVQLCTAEAVQAQRFHGITPELSSTGFPEADVIAAFALWRRGIVDLLFDDNRGLAGWRGYNRDFIAAVLSSPGWLEALGVGASGRCVMEEASEVLGAHNAVPRLGGSFRFPSLERTATWLRGRGHPVGLHAKRPGPNARCAAEVCLALARERDLLTQQQDAS